METSPEIHWNAAIPMEHPQVFSGEFELSWHQKQSLKWPTPEDCSMAGLQQLMHNTSWVYTLLTVYNVYMYIIHVSYIPITRMWKWREANSFFQNNFSSNGHHGPSPLLQGCVVPDFGFCDLRSSLWRFFVSLKKHYIAIWMSWVISCVLA